MNREAKSGFTLIELLVVISILGIIAGFAVSRYLIAEKQARDTQRKSDLNQYRVALENYAAANNSAYPIPSSCGNVIILCGTSNFQTTYLSGVCIQDPRGDASTYYSYCSDGIKYVLWAKQEVGSGVYIEVCSDGKSGTTTTAPALNGGGTCTL